MTRVLAVVIGGVCFSPLFLAGQGTPLSRPPVSGTSPAGASPDEQVLQAGKLPTDTPSLLEFFHLRAHHDGDDAQLKQLAQQLGNGSFKEREQASKQMLMRGPVALPYLKPLLKSSTVEAVRRAEALIRAIENSGPEQPVAAARLLAQRRADGAIAALLGYFPAAPDEWVEDEIAACLGLLAVKAGNVDPLLAAALDDKSPARRGAAAYVLGRRADTAARQAVRRLLSDPAAAVRSQAAAGLVGRRLLQSVRDAEAQDRKLLESQKIAAQTPALLDFLRQRTLDESDLERLRRLIRELGASQYAVRAEASRRLVAEGTPALAFLKEAQASADPEIARRARLCVEEIMRGPGPALPSAVARQLALLHLPSEIRPAPAVPPTVNPDAGEGLPRRMPDPANLPAHDKLDLAPSGPPPTKAKAAGAVEKVEPAEISAAIQALLGYVPFADDGAVEEEVINALTLLCLRDEALDPLLVMALSDPLPARRGAAAMVLGRVGTSEHLPGIRKLLDDSAAAVRFRAAQGLLTAKDNAGVAPLIALFHEMAPTQLWQIEDQLHRIAGERAPHASLGDASPGARAKVARAWHEWWAVNSSQLDLTRAGADDAFLGLYLICEYDSAVGMPGGQVWETARDGQERWKLTGLLGAMDAQLLPNGHILVAENSASRVTERDKNGNILWEHKTPGGNPVACQRLANGNTFIATYNQVMEISPDGRTVYNHGRGPAFYLFSAQKTKQGRIACMTAQGMILEIDPQTGAEVRKLSLGPNGGWCSAEVLPTGRYLVATMNNNLVREIDAQGKTHWQATFPGVFRATRLPNGHTLVASMTTKKIAELDRTGQPRWEKTCEGRPWSVHWR
jgi:HEAT repeat protein